MEYTKDIILDLGNGQVESKRNLKKGKLLKRFWNHISNHKIMTSIIIMTIGFIVLDMYLITSFMNVLTKI